MNLYTKADFHTYYHVMPFYDGNEKNIIAVYESSFRFQSYIAQAYQKIKDQDFTHFFIVADDLLINPALTESNLLEKLGLEDDECFITNFYELHLQKEVSYPLLYTIEKPGVEIKGIIPDYKEATILFNNHGLKTSKININVMLRFMMMSLYSIVCNVFKFSKMKYWIIKFLKEVLFLLKGRRLKYPLVWGYSDVLIVTKDVMSKFCTYCGAFAATGLFVEHAIPTSLVLSAPKIILDNQTKLQGLILGRGKTKQIFDEQYEFSLDKLTNEFPEKTFYIHPIKLSEWK